LVNKIDPGELNQGDVYSQPAEQLTTLPTDLTEAIDLLHQSEPAREWFGDDFVDHYVHMKRAEVKAQSLAVTDWEIARYLEPM
jgi:glutamine synthetase